MRDIQPLELKSLFDSWHATTATTPLFSLLTCALLEKLVARVASESCKSGFFLDLRMA
jgi:hypothetical protein